MPDNKIPETSPDIDVRINEVKYIECTDFSTYKKDKPCIYFEMSIENNKKESVSLGTTLVSRQLSKVG